MSRILTTLVAAALILAPIPAIAGDAEDAFLAKLVGTWIGTGTITGEISGKLACASTIRTVSSGIAFKVKCDVPEHGAQSFSGTVSYNDKEGRYEAKSQGQTTIGVKSGSTLTFASKFKGLVTGTSVMKLTSTKFTVDSKVKQPGSSGEITTHMVMTKS